MRNSPGWHRLTRTWQWHTLQGKQGPGSLEAREPLPAPRENHPENYEGSQCNLCGGTQGKQTLVLGITQPVSRVPSLHNLTACTTAPACASAGDASL